MEEVPFEETSVWIAALLFILLVLLPAGFVFLGAKIIHKIHAFRKSAVMVQGKVINVKETTSHDGESDAISYQPEFEFEGPNGEIMRGETAIGSSARNLPLGSIHSIMVNLDEPGTVHMPGNMPYILGAIILVLGGIAFFFGFGTFMTMI